jgi:molybdopterin-containing oxidoreductase family iron-sulfur binding subunit
VIEVPAETLAAPATVQAPLAPMAFDAPALDGEGLEFTLVVHPSPRFGDGALNGNRPWLIELPDPVSKIAWHSWVEIHPDAAARLNIRDGDVVTVTSPHGAVTAPAWLYPGIREDVISIPMGQGHTEVGRFGNAAGPGIEQGAPMDRGVGGPSRGLVDLSARRVQSSDSSLPAVNPLVLLPAVAEQPSGGIVYLATRVSVAPTGVRFRHATIAGSDDQHDRPIAMAMPIETILSGATAEEPEHEPLQELQGFGGFTPVPTEGRPEDFPLPGARYGEYADWEQTPRWAMAIDLDKCTGCSACVVACQAENNVPWVGEDQVRMGRDMGWIRLDRFYETVDAHAAGPVDVRHLPMMCQHCGNAPCEPVCPVFAAYHTPEGINGQVYNRCVGTRYCANNCPYKVRVFNWYTYTDVPEPMNWQYNPDVTVRENGVMEKCSFCTQRIREAQNRASAEGNRPLLDGEIIPACQQSCPAEAIVFGNIRDPNSRVAELSHAERSYRVLDDIINTQPGVSYLKKVTFHQVESGEH